MFWWSKEPSHEDSSFEYPYQFKIWLRNKKIYIKLRTLVCSGSFSMVSKQARGYKTFFILLNAADHKFILLINVKMPTIV